MTRHCTCLLLLAAILASMGCSAPAQQPQPAPPSDVPAASAGTSLGRIGAGDGSEGEGEPTAATPASGVTSIPRSVPAGPASSETPAQARVQAAKQQATQAQAQAAQAQAEQCSDLIVQIRTEQVTERQAPSTSIDEDIVAAAIAKADKRIDRLQQQYESVGCPDAELPSMHARVPQLPPAPGALPP